MEASTPGIAPSSDTAQAFGLSRSCPHAAAAAPVPPAGVAVTSRNGLGSSASDPLTSDDAAVGTVLAQVGTERGAAGAGIGDVVSALLEAACSTERDRPSSQLPPGIVGAHRLEAWLLALIEGYVHGRELRLQSPRSQEKVVRRATIAAVESERGRIARELHDEAGQLLVAAVFHLDRALTERRNSTPWRQILADARELMIESSRSLHRLSEHLRPPILAELGLAVALQWLVRKNRDQYDLEIGLRIAGIPTEIDGETELAVFRIAQEAIANAARHGRPKLIDVAIDCVDGQIEVTVRDDGAGFTPGCPMTPPASGGSRLALGIFGLKERVSALGGTLEIRSQPGCGTTLTAMLPLGGDVGRAA